MRGSPAHAEGCKLHGATAVRRCFGSLIRHRISAWSLAIGSAVVLCATTRDVGAQFATVPIPLQAEFLGKLAQYDRNFPDRAGPVAHVYLLVKRGNTKSELAASSMKSSLGQLDRMGSVPHEETVVTFDSAAALAKRCRDEHVAVLYVTPGFDDDIAALSSALNGVNLLTVSAVPEYVPSGMVLGFELQSGKPKIVLNYGQAKLQNVNFRAEVLNLMRVLQ